jgi:hypothetical protein
MMNVGKYAGTFNKTARVYIAAAMILLKHFAYVQAFGVNRRDGRPVPYK